MGRVGGGALPPFRGGAGPRAPCHAGHVLETADLSAALGRVRRVTGLPVAFGGAVAADGRAMRLTDFAGTVTGALHGLVVSAGHGLGGRVISTARPGRVEDYATDPRISHEYDKPVTAEGLRAIAAVPVAMGGSVLAVLYAGTREPLSVGTRALDAMGQVAVRVGTELTVRREVQRRIAELETTAVLTGAGPAAPEWEDVRQAHADLRTIAQEVDRPGPADPGCVTCARCSPSPAARRGRPIRCRRGSWTCWRWSRSAAATPRPPAGSACCPETVKSYLRNAMRKLGTHGRMETVVTARRQGHLP